MTHAATFFEQAARICAQIDHALVERLALELKALRDRDGRLFILGVGGSAANCGHAVNDFRKLCGIEAYAPTDKVAELKQMCDLCRPAWDIRVHHQPDADAQGRRQRL